MKSQWIIGITLLFWSTAAPAGYCENMKAIAYVAAVQRDAGVPERQLVADLRKKTGGKRNQDVEDLIAAAYMMRGDSPESFADFFHKFCKSLPGN
jgi:hypothetical protein